MTSLVVASLVLLAAGAVARAMRASRHEDALSVITGATLRTRPPRARSDRRTVAVGVLGAAIGWALGSLVGAAVGAVVGVLGVRWQGGRSARVSPIVAEERFADAVASVSAAVRSGASLSQALGYAAGESEPPVRADLERLVGDLEVGVPAERALERWREASPGPDVDLVVGALELHRRSGGELPAVLDQVTRSIRGRVSVAREVRSLTAQARLSAWILGLLPVGFFAFLWVTARSDVEGALGTPVGVMCLALGLLLEGGAVLWIRSLIRV
jgi:tight adherence protein B